MIYLVATRLTYLMATKYNNLVATKYNDIVATKLTYLVASRFNWWPLDLQVVEELKKYNREGLWFPRQCFFSIFFLFIQFIWNFSLVEFSSFSTFYL